MADQYYIDSGYFTPDNYFVYIADAGASLNSPSTLTCELGQVIPASALISATASLSADISVTRSAVSNQNSSATQLANVNAIFDNVITTQSVASQLTVVAKTGGVLVDINTAASLSCTVTRIRELARMQPVVWDEIDDWDDWPYDLWDPDFTPENLRATTELTANVLLVVANGASVQSTSSLISAITGFLVNGNANITSTAELLIYPVLNKGQLAADLESLATINAQAFRLLKSAEVSLSSSTTVSADVVRIQPGTVSMSAEFALNCQATLIPPVRGSADLSAQSSLTAEAEVRISAAADFASAFTQTTQINKRTGVIANVSSVFNVDATGFKVVFGNAQLLSQGFILTVGRVFGFDDYTTYIVEQETRNLLISTESRQWIIDQETAQLKIRPESRIYQVEQETDTINL